MIAPTFKKTLDLRRHLQDAFNVTTGHDHDGVNSASVSVNIVSPHVQYFQIEDLAANGDIAARALLECPTGYAITLTSAKIISQGSPTGIDDSNTSVFLLANGSNAIVSKTFNTTVTFPAANTTVSLGTLSATYKVMAAGDLLKFSLTNGTTADTPLCSIQIGYTMVAA